MMINQTRFANDLMDKYQMNASECRSSTPLPQDVQLSTAEEEQVTEKEQKKFRNVIGSLLYLSNCTRPDITHAVNSLARYMQNPRIQH
jgi:hypothetical protein